MMKISLFTSLLIISTNLFSQQQLNRSLFFDGLNRTYIVYIPAIYNSSSSVPVVFNFHGGGGLSSDFLSINDMRPVADTANFIAVYPQAATDPEDGSYSWMHKSPTTHNDVHFIEALLDTLSSEFNIDNERVYACGYSEGGIFSYELGCRLNNRIAAFSSVSGSMLTDSFRESYYDLGICSPTHPTAVMLIPGTNDFSPHSNYNGLDPYYMSVSEITSYWTNFNNTDSDPIQTQVTDINSSDGSTVERRTWENGDNCVSVEELKIIDGGHDWPGSFGNMDINATEEIWNFVSKFNKYGLINCSTVSNESSIINSDISLYPNPVNKNLYIIKNYKKYENYILFNFLGEIVEEGVLNQKENIIDLALLNEGFYVLKIGDISYKILRSI